MALAENKVMMQSQGARNSYYLHGSGQKQAQDEIPSVIVARLLKGAGKGTLSPHTPPLTMNHDRNHLVNMFRGVERGSERCRDVEKGSEI